MAGTSIEDLQSQIGYSFKNSQLLLEALTHSSHPQESASRACDNEKLEFLGDAVLNFVVSARLAETFPDLTEGMLSRARARLVAADHLARVAARLRLGEYLRMGRGEEKTGGRNKVNLQVDALEAIIAALYRDGGLEVACRFIETFVLPADFGERGKDLFSPDYKSALQEYLQAEKAEPAVYRVVKEIGPEHQKTFTVEAKVENFPPTRGSGASKKSAEQRAASLMLEKLRKKA